MFSKLSYILILIFGCLWPVSGRANPFGNTYVCVPDQVYKQSDPDFHIRERTPCAKGEQWMKVVVTKGGIIYLYPTVEPLPPEKQKELEEFKKYYGK